MKCTNGHSYGEMLHRANLDYGGSGVVTKISPERCPICKELVMIESSDFTPLHDCENEKQQARAEGIRSFAGKLDFAHPEFCKLRGEQFKECAKCHVDRLLAEELGEK